MVQHSRWSFNEVVHSYEQHSWLSLVWRSSDSSSVQASSTIKRRPWRYVFKMVCVNFYFRQQRVKGLDLKLDGAV